MSAKKRSKKARELRVREREVAVVTRARNPSTNITGGDGKEHVSLEARDRKFGSL
jgi:hypothetical protein